MQAFFYKNLKKFYQHKFRGIKKKRMGKIHLHSKKEVIKMSNNKQNSQNNKEQNSQNNKEDNCHTQKSNY